MSLYHCHRGDDGGYSTYYGKRNGLHDHDCEFCNTYHSGDHRGCHDIAIIVSIWRVQPHATMFVAWRLHKYAFNVLYVEWIWAHFWQKNCWPKPNWILADLDYGDSFRCHYPPLRHRYNDLPILHSANGENLFVVRGRVAVASYVIFSLRRHFRSFLCSHIIGIQHFTL